MTSFTDLFNLVLAYCQDKVAKEELTEVSFNLWINSLHPIEMKGNTAIFSVPSEFQRDIIINNYSKLLKEAFLNVLSFDVELEIICIPPEISPDDEEEKQSDPSVRTREFKKALQRAEYDYTFDTFIVGSSNEFAYAASTAVAENPGRSYNPLFIHGPSGLGKTHLLTAISNRILEDNPDTNIIYVTGEAFSNELINAIQHKKDTYSFHQKFRSADVLLVDDIHFIAGKESTQEEFFHTFNELHKIGKQIVLTSDRPPKDIKTLEDRIRTRFEWGLIADINIPDFETRVAIVKRKAELLDFYLSDEIATYIANQLKSNIRQLEGCVKKIKASRQLVGTPTTILQAQNAVRAILSDDRPIPITFDRVMAEITTFYDVTTDEIISNKRLAKISLARKVCSYILKETSNMSYNAIGMELGGRDNSTIIYYHDDVSGMIKKDPSIKATIDDIIKNIKSPV